MPSVDTARARADLLRIYDAAIRAVQGGPCVARWLRHASNEQVPGNTIALIALGKAACSMARGAHEVLGHRITQAYVVTRHGHAQALPWPVRTAGHPVPDAASIDAGEGLLEFVRHTPPDQAVLVLLSGGASSLVEALPAGLTLDQLQRVNGWLLGSGLAIDQVNAVRKRLSRIKGGRLAAALAPRRVLGLIISDVPGDDPAVIASGPLSASPRPTIPDGLPAWLRAMLEAAPDLPDESDPAFDHVRLVIVASNRDACAAAADAAQGLGYKARIVAPPLSGDALESGRIIGNNLAAQPAGEVYIHGGETTVTLPANPGRGGRCQALALAAALELAPCEDCLLLAAGTDGADGASQDAGALVDCGTVARAEDAGADARQALAAADSGRVLELAGDLITTGPTGTNVMDLVLTLRIASNKQG